MKSSWMIVVSSLTLSLCFSIAVAADKAQSSKKKQPTVQERAEKKGAPSSPPITQGLIIEDLEVTQVGVGEVKVLRPDGIYPRWSPGGETILFTGTKGGLWMMSHDGKNARQLVADGSFGNWSPDGKRIVFLRERPQVYDDIAHDLMIYDLAKKKEFLILENIEKTIFFGTTACWSGVALCSPAPPVWAHDSNEIELRVINKVVTTTTGRKVMYVFVNLDTLKPTPLSTWHQVPRARLADDHNSQLPKFFISADNRYSGAGIWASDGSRAILLVPGEVDAVDVSPDLKRLVFGALLENGQHVIVSATLKKIAPWNTFYEIPVGMADGVEEGAFRKVFQAKLNPLNNKVIGYDSERPKGLVKVAGLKESTSLVELVEWNGTPVQTGDVLKTDNVGGYWELRTVADMGSYFTPDNLLAQARYFAKTVEFWLDKAPGERLQDSIRYMEKARTIVQDDPDINKLAARAYLLEGAVFGTMESDIKKAIDLDPESLNYCGVSHEATECRRKVMRLAANDLLDRDPAKAKTLYELAATLEPRDPQPVLNLARYHSRSGNSDEALAQTAKAYHLIAIVEHYEAFTSPWCSSCKRGEYLTFISNAKDFEAIKKYPLFAKRVSMAVLQSTIEQIQDNKEVYSCESGDDRARGVYRLTQGALYEKEWRFELFHPNVQWLSIAFDIFPGLTVDPEELTTKVRKPLACMLIELGNNSVRSFEERAVAAWTLAYTLAPDNPYSTANLIKFYSSQHEPEQAFKWFEKGYHAIAGNEELLSFVKFSPECNDLREHPKYKALVKD